LFKQDHRGIRDVTEPGRVFIENAFYAIEYKERATSLARAASAGKSGRLQLGVSPTIDLGLFLRIQKAFQDAHPQVALDLISAFSLQQAYSFMRSDLHAGIMKLPIRCRGLSVLSTCREPVLLVMKKNDKLAEIRNLSPERLAQRSLILLA
jgi:DNA-binding transcriptional LysR family regulator